MATAKRLIKNIFISMLSQAVTIVLSAFFTIYLAKHLGPINYGKYVFAAGFSVIFFTIFDFIEEIATREIAKDKSQAARYLANSIILKSILFVALYIIIYCSVNLMGYPHDTIAVASLLSFYFFLHRLNASVSSVFVANERVDYTSLAALGEKIIIVFLSIYILIKGGGLTSFVWAFIIAAALKFIVLNILVRRYAKIKLIIDFELWKYLIKVGAPLLLAPFFIILLSKSCIILLSLIQGDKAVGLYGIAYSFYDATTFISLSFTASLFPLFSRYAKESKESALLLYKISFKLLFAIAVFITVMVLALSKEAIFLLFKKDYTESIGIIRLIFLALPLYFVRNLCSIILVSINKQKQIMIGLGLALFFNFLLNSLLIPKFSYYGACLSIIVSEIIIFTVLFGSLSKYFFKLSILNISIRALFIGSIVFLFAFYFKTFNVFLAAGLSVLLFLALIFLIRFFPKTELEVIKTAYFKK